MSDIVYSNINELNRAAREQGLLVPENRALENPANTITDTASTLKFEDLPEDILGEQVAYMMQRYQTHGYVPTFKEAIAYRKYMASKEASFLKSTGDAISQTTSDLVDASAGIVGDALTLKLPKVVGSAVEGAALGTKNWFYMYEQAKYDEHSFLSKMLYGNHASDEDYYENLKKTIELNKLIEKDRKQGIIVPPKVKIGDTEIDLTNPAVVQGISYVADPSWAVPNLGVEAAVAKSLRGAGMAIKLGEQLSTAGAFASKKAAIGFGKLADFSGGIANAIQTIDDNIVSVAKDITGKDHYIAGQGSLQATDAITRNAENSLGVRIVKIPLWPLTTATFGISKVVEGVGRMGEAVAKNAFDPSAATTGLTLSERVAKNSDGSVATISNFYSKSVSPLSEWMTKTAKTSFHSGMYGGAFGLAFGGEEGAYHGFGTGLVLGSAFHQVGVFANAVVGGDRYRTVLKNFLWATEHYDYYNQEGVYHLMNRVAEKGGEEARYSLMAKLGAVERILRDEKMLILTEERIKEMSSADEWTAYEREMLSKAEFGGVTFTKDKGGDSVILINADRAVQSAITDELFHGILLSGRYKKAFVKHTMENLIGTEDNLGALYKMPKEQAVRLLESFRDQYFSLDKETAGHNPAAMELNLIEYNKAIESFKAGEKPTVFRGFFEEFLASYWNRFIDDKPIDYLLKGGDLGLIRNAIQWGKDTYRDMMRVDLGEAGVQFKVDGNPDAFLIDQTTKQRIRVPMLEKLMKHYVKEIKNEMYSGWQVNKEKYRDTFSLLNQELDHLVPPEDVGSVEARVNPDSVRSTITQSLQSATEKLSQLDPSKRGTKIEVMSEKGVTLASFLPAKRSKNDKPEKTVGQILKKPQRDDFWRTLPKAKAGIGVTRTDLREMGGTKKGKEPKEQVLPATEGTGAWETERGSKARGEFWESVWQGNPRLKITGVASKEELAIFREYLPENVVRRFAELNQVIERAKVDQLKDISNILKATVITESKERDDGTRVKGHFIGTRRFMPVELNLYFTRVKKSVSKKTGDITYQVGEANLKVTVLDWDALLKREDYAFNKVDDGDLNYRTVQRLFGSRAELREAVKAMLANYSLGSKAQAGIKLFMGGRGGERDAALKRDIVNAVIGYHPTKGMEQSGRGWYNEPRTMQFRKGDGKVKLPTTMTDFRVDLIGKMAIEDGEGFRYNHDEAYKRGQANFSPAITHRDHEGNPMPSHARAILANTKYRNKEGEIIAVYPLRTATSEMLVKEGANKIYDIVAEDLVDAMEKKGIVRGNMYTSKTGWLHFTADGYEAGYTARDKMRSGYINTSKHLDISDLGNSGSIRSMVVEIGKRINEITGLNSADVIKQILELRDENGNKLYDIFKNDTDIISTHLDPIDAWLFTPESKKLFAKLGIDSVEYKAVNPNSDSQFAAVAIIAPERFIENRGRQGLERFQFSPSRSVEESLRRQIQMAGGSGLSALLKYRIDETGKPVPNTKRITTKTIDDIVRRNIRLVEDAQKAIKSGGLLNEQSKIAYEKALIPYVIRELKNKFPKVDEDVLSQIAQYSLQGFVSYVETLPELRRVPNQPFGATTEIVTREIRANSAFIETALKMGITPEALMDTGIPSLGHWMEMSQAEFETLRNWPKVVEQIRNQEKGQMQSKLAALKELNQYETWLAEFRKANKTKRTAAEIRYEGETSVLVEEKRTELTRQLLKPEEIEERLEKQFPAYREVKNKNIKKQERLRKEEEARFASLSDFAKTLSEVPKDKRKQFIKNSETKTTGQLEIIKKVLGDNNGITGLMDNLGQRQRELFFFMDETLGGGNLGDKFNLSHNARRKLTTEFILRTRKFVAEQLKLGKDASLKKIKDAYDLLVESGRDIPQEAADAMAVLAEHERRAESIINRDNVDRIMDIMAAYSIKELDLDLLDKVRAKIYDEASQGFYQIGSPEAIARSVELYAIYDGGKNKRYIDVRKTIKENFIKALDELERKGMRGVYWSKLDTSRTNDTITLGVNAYTGLPNKFKVQYAMRFEGTDFYLMRRTLKQSMIDQGKSVEEATAQSGTLSVLELVDGNGTTLDRMVYDRTELKEVIVDKKNAFLQRATMFVSKVVPEMAVANGKFQTVEGPIKQYLLKRAVKQSGRSEKDIIVEEWISDNTGGLSSITKEGELAKTRGGRSVITSDEEILTMTKLTSNWELFRNGDYFLAWPVSDERKLPSGRTVAEEINYLKAQLKSGTVIVPKQGRTPESTRTLTIDEKTRIREDIARLQKDVYVDLGFTFKVNNKYGIEILESSFTDIAQRERHLSELKLGHMQSKGFEAFVKKIYVGFEKKLAELKASTEKKIDIVLSEKDKRGAIPQIKELLQELHQYEAVKKKFVTNEMLAYNKANKARGTGKKNSVDGKAMHRLLKDRLANYSRVTKEAEIQYLAVAEQMRQLNLLTRGEGFTPEDIESLEFRLQFADEQELRQYMLPPPPKGVALANWATNLRMEFRKRLAEFEYRDRMHEQLRDNLYGTDEKQTAVIKKIEFLVERYMAARGYDDIDTSYYFRKSTEEGDVGYTDIKWKELKAGIPVEEITLPLTTEDTDPSGPAKIKTDVVPKQKSERKYLQDKEGILDTPLPDEHKTPEELIKEFTDGIEEAADMWYIGKNRDQMHIDDVLKWGRQAADGEHTMSGALIRSLSKDKFDATELAWINNKENKSQVAEFHRRWASEESTPTEIIQEIKDAVLASHAGKDGLLLKETVKALNETIRKIGVVSDRLRVRYGVEASLTPKEMQNPYARRAREMIDPTLDPIHTYRKDMPNDIGKLQEEINNLRKQKIALETRYRTILKKASGKHASPEFRKMVEQMKGEDVREQIARKNTSQRRAEEKAFQKQLASSEKELFKLYDDIAKNMRTQNPELVFENSRIEVHPNNPRTQYLFYSFGALSWDFFGSNWQLDLSLTTAGSEKPRGLSGQGADISPTESPIIKGINRQERNAIGKRRIFLADYIHYAVNKRRWHENNPSAPMSAMDANLFGLFFKRDVQNGLFRDKIAKIPVEQMQMQEAMNNGIIETFRNPDEKSRFIRSWVVDALDLISTNKALREKAFMNLKGINYEQYQKLVAENPKYVEQALDSLEVIEKAMYLIKDGIIPAGESGEVFNKRDFFSGTYSIEENLFIKKVEAKHGFRAGTIKQILEGRIQGVALPREIQTWVNKRKQPFLTRANIGFVPVDTLIRMHGFDEIWRQHLSDEGYNTALFALDGMWNVKRAYEQMPPQERMALQSSRISRLLLENRANQMQAARELKERYRRKDKSILAPDSMQNWAYGKEDSIVKDEFKRVDEVLKTAMSVEATIQRYKGDAITFVNKRPFALDHLLALKDDLRIDGAKRNKDRTLTVDWDNPDKPQWRDTIDGRYFIKREVNSKGKESFKVYFKGQTFKTAEGVAVGQIGITSFATVENLTQAQVAIRFFEDDVNRVVLSSRLIKGGVKRFEPLAVGEKVLPAQNVDQLFTVWDEVPSFSKKILDLYMENKGTPFFREQMAEKLAGIGQYGETVYIKEFNSGRWSTQRVFITPSETGKFAKHYTKTLSPDGHDMYIRNKDAPPPEPANLGSDSSTNQEQATNTPAVEKPDKVEQTVSDASNWDVIEMDKSKSGDFDEWSVIKNKLGYTMIRLKNPTTGRSVFRLFNPASAFMAETHHEIEAMEYILEKELE